VASSAIEFLARELAPTQRRFIEAARTAVKATVTTGCAATLQILGPFGALFAFRLGQPGISFGLFEGGLTIVSAAIMQAAIVPITGKLLDYPGLIIAFLFVVFATVAYLLSNTRLFLILALVAVGTITTVYVGIFEPGQIGWGSTYTFDGILAATLVMVAVDSWIWPSPAEPKLLESVAADFERSRMRLEMVEQRYLDPLSAPLPTPLLASRLASHLALLESIKEHDKPTPEHLARLLDAVVTAERVFLEVERLAVLADEPVSDEIRRTYRYQLKVVLSDLDAVLARRAQEVLAGIQGVENPVPGVSPHLRGLIEHLKDASAQILTGRETATAGGASNFAGFVDALDVIENLLATPLFGRVASEATGEEKTVGHEFFNSDRFRFSVKLGATMVSGLQVGLTTQRADLQTILWSIAVAGQPNQYGAVLRKTILRLVGCIMGGLAALGAMLLVSENFDSLPAYLVAIFAVTFFSTYLSQSSDWLNYAGIQTGITFLICYVGLGPSSDIYRPLWRFWGIVLGVLTTGFVFLFLWPEYASDKLVESLSKLIRTTVAFAKDVTDGTVTETQIAAVERRLSTDLFEVLNLADQAKLEGRRGLVNSTNGVNAAATLIRIAYRFQVIARARGSGAEATLPHEVLAHRFAQEREYCDALESKINMLESVRSPDRSPAPLKQSVNEFTHMTDDLTTRAALESGDLAAQLESYRRLPVLLEHLDAALSKIVVS
jgi:Fusaric acid resistance protein family